jgi:tyrosinase
MDMTDRSQAGVSRRQLLATGAVMAGAAFLPGGAALAQLGKPRTRYNVLSTDGKRMMGHYATALRQMLDLPADDPRHWYRQAITHYFDCPHGNWWILPWHRGFTLQVEQICRDLSGQDDFAFPYWDWTEAYNPTTKRSHVPDIMFDGIFDPNDEAFIGSWDTFKRRFEPVLAKTDYWTPSKGPPGNNPDADGNTHYGQLLNRGNRFPADTWFDFRDDPRGYLFFEKSHAREGVTRAAPWLDARTSDGVSPKTIEDALGPTDFKTFASSPAANHSQIAGFGILERKPHNRVHNNVGGIVTKPDPANPGSMITIYGQGFMQSNLSPTDPIFFLHHSNLDRLWDVWTRKQLGLGLSPLPDGYTPGQPPAQGSDYEAWAGEQFLFFVDAKGKPLGKRTAADYQSIVPFNYTYQPGSGEGVVPGPTKSFAVRRGAAPRQIAAETQTAAAAAPGLALKVTAPLLQTAADRAVRHYAKVTVALPHAGPGAEYTLEIHTGNPDAPILVEALSMFGHHAGGHGLVTFVVPVTTALQTVSRQKSLRAGGTLHFRVRSDDGAHHAADAAGAAPASRELQVLHVVIEAH